MSSAEHIYSIADNHAQTVQVCIDRLHELGANEQSLDGKVAKVGDPGAPGDKELRPTRAEAPVETMSTTPSKFDPFAIGTSVVTIPMGLRILAIVLRALFIGALVAVTVRVSSPQSESLASVYETPGDLIRLALGFAVCLWIVIHLFMLPRTAEGYRTWVYLGLVVAPLALAAAIAIW